MDFLWFLELDPDLLICFMGAIEVAALRALCKTTQQLVADAPEEAFDFSFSSIIPLLPRFDRYQELQWVILRLAEDNSLVQRKPSTSRHRRVLYRRWRRWAIVHGIVPDRHSRMMLRRDVLDSLIWAFWNHPDVQALLALAIRLDSASLLRRLAAEAPSEYDFCDSYNDGTANFMYEVWVAIEETQFQEHGPWEPPGRDDATEVDPLFFGTIHFVLWK